LGERLAEDFNVNEYFASMRRCTICILPETFPGIEFDEEGVCNYCKGYRRMVVKGEKELLRVLSQYRNKGQKYDCVIPISGGRDSSFVLHQMVRKYRTRALALTVDSGTITPEGVRNIERITHVLGVDHIWIRDENQIKVAQENTRIKFHGWLKKPSINTIVPVLNSADKTMNLRICRYAEDHGIPLVFGGNIVGNSNIEQDHFKTGYMGVFPDERGMYSTHDKMRLMFLFWLEFIGNRYNFSYSILKEYVEGAAVYFFESRVNNVGVRQLGFYDYIYWNEKEILTTLFTQLDWKGAPDTTATWRIGDAAYPLIDYLYLELVGFNQFDELYSKMIREGQISREDALKKCMNDHAPRMSLLMETFDKMKVEKEQVDEALERYRAKLLGGLLKRKQKWRARARKNGG